MNNLTWCDSSNPSYCLHVKHEIDLAENRYVRIVKYEIYCENVTCGVQHLSQDWWNHYCKGRKGSRTVVAQNCQIVKYDQSLVDC